MSDAAKRPHFVSASCAGEHCSLCGKPATHKIGEAIQSDDPMPGRHNMTAHVCCAHFTALMGKAAGCTATADQESVVDQADYEALFWLAAREVVFFSTYNSKIEDWDNGWHAVVNCSDTFYWASADAESLAPGRESEVKAIYDRFSWHGVIAWCALERGIEPLEKLRTDAYRQARAVLEAARTKAAGSAAEHAPI